MNYFHEALDILRKLIDSKIESEGMNEAQTRFHLIDHILKECLNWNGFIEVEQYKSLNGFTDYELGVPRKVVVEAKREGSYFQIPAGMSKKNTTSLKSLIIDNSVLKDAIDQVREYASERGIPIAVVTNGHQYVAFIAVRVDGVNVMDGDALVFDSLENIFQNFTQFWNCLSFDGIKDNRINRQLLDGDLRLPNKLSTSLVDYPKIRYGSDLQVTLRQLSELFIQDVMDNPDLEKDFLQQCYCESGALNKFALLSKNILNARYASIFNSSEDQPLSKPVREKNKDNFDPSIMSEAMSRRPIVLVGDVGVGKTSFVKNLIHNSAHEEFKKAIYIYIDLGSKATLDTDLKELVLDQIQQQLFDVYDVDINKRSFIKRVYFKEVQRFESGLWGSYKEKNPEKYEEKLIDELVSLQSITGKHTQRSVQQISKERSKQVILCLDNADQRAFDIQQEAFIISQELAKEWKTTVFLSVRPQTFYKSKRSGALNAYPHKIFTIAPPRVDEVVSKRLVFAAKMARGAESGISLGTFTSENLAVFLDVLVSSLNKNRDLNEFLTNVAGGNIRSVIEFVTSFIGSPNVEAQKIIDIAEKEGKYLIPVHEFTKQALLGDYSHYSPDKSISMNVLDLSTPDPKEHFLVPLIISYLSVPNSSSKDKDGFCRAEMLMDEFQNHGFTQKQIESSLRRSTNKKLIETSLRVTFEEDEDSVLTGDMPTSFRVTTIGAYHIQKWLGDFSYLDAMLFDTPILDIAVREKLLINISSLAISDRLDRTNIFKEYLLSQWRSFTMAPSYFDFENICSQGDVSFDRVSRVVQSNRDKAGRN